MQKLAASQQTVSQLPASETPAWLAVAKPDPGAYVYKPVARRRHLPARLHQLPRPERRRQGDPGRSSRRRLGGRGASSQLQGGPVRPARDAALEHPGDLRRREHGRQEGGGYVGISLHGLDGARRHAEANSPGHPSPGDDDADPGAPACEYRPIARRERPDRQHAEHGEGAVLDGVAGPDAAVFPDYEKKRYAFKNNSLLPPPSNYPPYSYQNSPFVDSTYDKEMWLHLCSDFSPQVVRVYGTFSAPTNKGRPAVIQLVKMYYAVHPDPVAPRTQRTRPITPPMRPSGITRPTRRRHSRWASHGRIFIRPASTRT